MAMNGDNLGDEMKAAVDALSSPDRSDLQKCLRALGRAIVSHIRTNADVATSTPNVQTGSDTKAGTGTIT